MRLRSTSSRVSHVRSSTASSMDTTPRYSRTDRLNLLPKIKRKIKKNKNVNTLEKLRPEVERRTQSRAIRKSIRSEEFYRDHCNTFSTPCKRIQKTCTRLRSRISKSTTKTRTICCSKGRNARQRRSDSKTYLINGSQVEVSLQLSIALSRRVTIQEDEKGTLHLKNLSFRIVRNAKEALQFLLDGDAYRAISETPMNPRSSRSHCIFTIVVSVKKFGANRYSRAKMHLVDLAGSERVYKCAIQGTILTEAKHINLSLHFLEQVIVCLGQDNSSHVPYRNSLLTSVLRDSLGGNCLTTMLANISVSNFNLEETISTCRFAQRVALVKNDVNLTFELDEKSENMLLKLENERLRKEIGELKGRKVSEVIGVGSVDYYKNLVIQRDREISHLIDLLREEKSRRKSAIAISEASKQLRYDEKYTQTPTSRSSRKNDQVSPNELRTERKCEYFHEKMVREDPLENKSEKNRQSPEVTQRKKYLNQKTISGALTIHVPSLNLEEKNDPVAINNQELHQQLSGTLEINTNRPTTAVISTGCNTLKNSPKIKTDRKIETPKMSNSNTIDVNQSPKIVDGNDASANGKMFKINVSTAKNNLVKDDNRQFIESPENPIERPTRTPKMDESMAQDFITVNLRENKEINTSTVRRELPKVDNPEKSVIEAANTVQPIESPKNKIENDSQAPSDDSSSIQNLKHLENDTRKNTARENTGKLEFPQEVMKMLRTSRNWSADDQDGASPPAAKSETPRKDYETSNVLRDIPCIEKNTTVETVTRVQDEGLGNMTKISRDANTDNIVGIASLLTGDPDIDEEIIAFYEAKKAGRLY